MEKYQIKKVLGHKIETDMTDIDTHSPEECLALFIILGSFSIKFQMIGLLEKGEPMVRYYANIEPTDKEEIVKDVQKLVREEGCKDILGKKYDEYLKGQEALFDEVKMCHEESLN